MVLLWCKGVQEVILEVFQSLKVRGKKIEKNCEIFIIGFFWGIVAINMKC